MKFAEICYYILEEGRPSFKDKKLSITDAAREHGFKDGSIEEAVVRYLEDFSGTHGEVLKFIQTILTDQFLKKNQYGKVPKTRIAKQARVELKELIGNNVLEFVVDEPTDSTDDARTMSAVEETPPGHGWEDPGFTKNPLKREFPKVDIAF